MHPGENRHVYGRRAIPDENSGVLAEANRAKADLGGTLKTRPMDKPVYDPSDAGLKMTSAPWVDDSKQLRLLENDSEYETEEK